LEKGFIGCERVVNRCRIRVLGGKPVIDGDDPCARPPADLRGQPGSEGGVAHHVDAAVEIEDNVASLYTVDCDLGGRDAAQCGWGHGDVRGQRLRREQFSENAPLLIDVAADGEGSLSEDRVKGLSLLDAHGRSSFC
jgi:hypothetical protein